MAGYLRKYVGQYRVIAEYDLETLDFPREENGNLDNSFDGLYIDCANHIKIRHGVGSILSVYIPSKSSGMNILRQIWVDKVSKDLPKETPDTQKYLENLCDKLVELNILESAEVLDFEVYFTFNAKYIDYYATLLKAKTSGAKISPFSNKNLPKESYIIPKDDLTKYQDAIKDFPKRKMGDREMIDGLYIRQINKKFIKKNKLTNNTRLKDKEFIHKSGMWNKYIKYLESICHKQKEIVNV